MSSQFFRKALQTPAVSAGLQAGNYGALKTWLAENIYRHGRSSSPKQTVQRVTGGPLDPAPYIADLTAKVDMLTA